MPRSNYSGDLRPCGNLNGVDDSPGSDANRLRKLENEVTRLRSEIDKIKWQRAAAETAIERAIVRGAAALGGRYKILVPLDERHRDRREFPNADAASNESIASSKNRRGRDACEPDGNDVKGNKAGAGVCGQYTLG